MTYSSLRSTAIEHQAADLRRFHHARERHLRRTCFLGLPERVADAELRRAILGELADVGADGTGTEDRHADVFLQQLVANAFRDRHDGRLGRDINHELRGHRDERRE